MELKVGDRVRRNGHFVCTNNGEIEDVYHKEGVITSINGDLVIVKWDTPTISGEETWSIDKENWELIKASEVQSKMEIKDMNKKNVEVAKEQCIEEAKNAEIEEAKNQYNAAVDERDKLEREIIHFKELKVKQQEILDSFKGE